MAGSACQVLAPERPRVSTAAARGRKEVAAVTIEGIRGSAALVVEFGEVGVEGRILERPSVESGVRGGAERSA